MCLFVHGTGGVFVRVLTDGFGVVFATGNYSFKTLRGHAQIGTLLLPKKAFVCAMRLPTASSCSSSARPCFWEGECACLCLASEWF